MSKRKRKRRLKIKRILILIVIIFIITLSLINKNNIRNYFLSKTTGYSEKTISVILEENILKEIKNKEYSKTLEKIINTNYYDKLYINEYLNIKYKDEPNFLENIQRLLDKGYTNKNINDIYEKLNNESITFLIEKNYIEDITNIINLNYFDEIKLSRYIDYYEKEKKDYETTVTYVNIGLDNDFYTNVIKIKEENNIAILVNKYNSLNKNYIPEDLETINKKYQWLGRKNQLRKDARIAFEKMCEDAIKDNIYIYAGSGYRSYDKQNTIYRNYINTDGFANAETYSARPGYSEHQTGLAMDITTKTDFIAENDEEFAWLTNNAHKYGFILRYPKNKDNITGYMYEEWHYRYLGVDLANKVYNSKLTYDEYVARNLN